MINAKYKNDTPTPTLLLKDLETRTLAVISDISHPFYGCIFVLTMRRAVLILDSPRHTIEPFTEEQQIQDENVSVKILEPGETITLENKQ